MANAKLRLAPVALLMVGAMGCDNAADSADTSSAELSGGPGMLAPRINLSGFAQTATPTGTVDTTNPFFQSLGTNGRACGTCHGAGEGWTITPIGVTLRFLFTQGTDPIFLPHDGANAPELDVSTPDARWNAYSMLRTRGTIRIGLPVKPTSEFELALAEDPYGHASAAELSLFRRPLPTTNLRFLSTINWDGRSTVGADPASMTLGLKNQSNGATVKHAQAAAPIDDATRQAIVDFETSLHTAQVNSFTAGDLDDRGATGGPVALLTAPFTLGATATPPTSVFATYGAWSGLSGGSLRNVMRRHVAAGQAIFNARTFTITTPSGSFSGTCSGCHNTPEIGGRATTTMFDVGISAPERRSPSVPLYTLRNKMTGETVQTTDPGRALITGLWADMNKFKVPGLRALAARAPYFHDGSVSTLRGVVDHYDAHFGIGFSDEEKRDLVMFLESL
jgi:cytochrome c peroxidase